MSNSHQTETGISKVKKTLSYQSKHCRNSSSVHTDKYKIHYKNAEISSVIKDNISVINFNTSVKKILLFILIRYTNPLTL